MFHRIKTWFTSSSSQERVLHLDLARLLHSSLIASAVISFISIISVVLTNSPNWERSVRDASIVFIVSLIFLFLLRRGYERLVAYGIVASFTVIATFAAYTGIGVRGTAYGLLLIVILISALFLHRRAAYGMAFISSFIGLGLVWASRAGRLPNAEVPLAEVATWLIQTAYFFITAVVLDIALRQIDQALRQADHELAERKQAEEKILTLNAELEERVAERTSQLANSEERYRRITTISSDYVYSSLVDAQGKVHHNWVAGAFENIMGYTFEEYIANGGWLSVLHPDDFEQDARDMAVLFLNKSVATEVRIITRAGEIRWVRIYAQPIWNEDENRLAEIYGAVQDITARKLTEQALREAEIRYRTLVERTSVVIYRNTPDKAAKTIFISPQIETLLGYTTEAWMKGEVGWQTLIHPADAERIIVQLDIHLAKRGSYLYEYRLRDHQGGWVWVRDEAAIVEDEAGNPMFMQGVLINITEQKTAEAQTQEVTQGLRSVVEVADELILIPDLDTFYRRAVELAREKLNLERCSLFLFDDELKYQRGTYGTTDQGITSDERFLKLDLKGQVADRLLREGERAVIVVEGKHVAWDMKDRARVVGQGWIATTLIRSSTQPIGVFSNDAAISNSPINESQQEILLIYCSLLGNIIERKWTEEALKNNEKRFRALVEQLPAITYSDDITELGRTIYISPQVETILGYTPQEWIKGGLDFWLNHIYPDDQDQALKDIETCFYQGHPIQSAYRMYKKTGELVWMQDRAVRLEDENGQPTLIQGVMTDITEQKQAEERVRNVSEGLRAVLAAADELILAPDLDTIYRRAVELARQKLGIERGGLFLFDKELTNQIATFGTDEQGNTTDERGIVREISSWAVDALLTKGERSWLIIDDSHSYWDEGEEQKIIGRGWIASTIIRSNTHPIGVFYNDAAIRHSPVNETQQEILTVYCSLLGNIIERKQFEQHLKTQTAQLTTIYELSREIVSLLDLEQVYAVAHRAVRQLIPTEAFFIALVDEEDEEHQEIEDVYLYDQEQRWPSRRTPLSTRGMTTRAIQTGEAICINDWDKESTEALSTVHFGGADSTRSVLVVPMKLSGKAIGVISAQHYSPHIYTPEHIQTLEALANQIAIAIDHGRLVQSLGLQAAALNAAANAIVITDRNGIIQWTNPAFTLLTGYTADEAMGKTINLLKSGVHDEAFYQHLWHTIVSGKTWQGEITNRRKDGELYVEEMIITPVKNDQGDMFRFIAIKQDITIRKHAEERDERRRKLLEKVLELGKAVTQETNLISCLRQIHQSVQKGLGFDRVGLFLYEEHTDSIRGAFGTTRTGEIEDTSFYVQTASESATWLNALRNPSGMTFYSDFASRKEHGYGGEMVGVLEHVSITAWAGDKPVALIAADNLITQRKITPENLEALKLFAGYAGLAIENARWNAQLGERVTERTTELQAANQELQAFTYTIAHDLRAPARAMIGFSGLLEEHLTEQVELDPTSLSYLARVRNGAKRMGQMIDELLEYTRLGRAPIIKQPVDMNAKAQRAYEKAREEFQDRLIEIHFRDLPPCEGDPKLIGQVWSHLLGNALKYTRSRPVAKIDVGFEQNQGEIVYYVRDNGIGFDMKYLHKLFGVFQRLHIEDEFEGTGMGLAIAERIVERHSGRIWAIATPDEGATFFFTLG